MKYHSHEMRREVWTILSGNGHVILENVERRVFAGDVIDIPARTKHNIIAESEMSIIEVRIGDEIDDVNQEDER